jgi:hypothetical protein
MHMIKLTEGREITPYDAFRGRSKHALNSLENQFPSEHATMQVHDKLVYGMRRGTGCRFQSSRSRRGAQEAGWAPTLPLEAEAGVGRSYGEAK